MLPSDNISSLVENTFTCDIIVDANTFLVKSKSFKNCLIEIR